MNISTVQGFDWKQLLETPENLQSYDIMGNKAILNFAVATDATDTATTTTKSVVKTLVLADIVKYAQEKSYFLNAVKQVAVEPNTKSVKIPVVTSNLTFDEQQAAWGTTTYETEVRDWTELTNVNVVELTYSLYKYGSIISKTMLKTASVDLIAHAKDQLAFNASRVVDTAIASALGGASSPADTLYGGDATSTATVADGDILTTDLIADAITTLDNKGWENDQAQPYLLFISPKQKAALLKDSQFTNAAEYGNNSVVLNGEIGQYLGAKVIVSTRLPDISSTAAATAATRCMMVKSQVCGAIAWFEKPNIDGEYDKETASARVYLDMAFSTATLQEDAIVLLEVSDA